MKNTLAFLRKIKKNNNTPWMHAHKDEYLLAKKEFEFLVQELIVRLREWDKAIPHLEVKDCVFRFNRDTRFSENKSPYKENFGAWIAYGGKKGPLPGYYLHVSAKELFVAGGVWMPEARALLSLRRHICVHGGELTKILADKKFKKVFPALDSGHLLKRPPKGFSADDPFVEFLKHKSFTVSAPLAMAEATKPAFGKLVDKHFRLLGPLNEFLLAGVKHSEDSQ
ncbi:MAG TPA: DUF2461 domain-containing protein [Bacteriovoracaceae bacterium]|nr:DUF2461 domain-containing protein [Bacteriovoracaceae bacterium]